MTKVLVERVYREMGCGFSGYSTYYMDAIVVPDDWTPPKSVEEALEWEVV